MESSTSSHLSVAMTTEEDNTTQTAGGIKTSSSSSIFNLSLQYALTFIGVVGTAGNALIMYALVASKQHKKHALIVNQNALDLFSSFFLVVKYAMMLCNVYLAGTFGHFLCVIIFSEFIIWWGMAGSAVNLAAITVDRYLKAVHPIWSKKWLRRRVIYMAMAFSWIMGFIANSSHFFASAVIDGVCYGSVYYLSEAHKLVSYILYVLTFYVVIVVIFIFCYGSILVTIRRQARVMAGHDATGSSTTQTQSHQNQSSVIKTMLLISVLYAVTYLPSNVVFLMIILAPYSGYLIDVRFYSAVFIAFICPCANPFIYATKFDPVKKILSGMIVWKRNSVQSSDGSGTSGSRTGSRRT